MIRLYCGSGSREIEFMQGPRTRESWAAWRTSACRLMRARKAVEAAQTLEDVPFDLYVGTNSFGDDFLVLCLDADVERYVAMGEQAETATYKLVYASIASTLNETSTEGHVRFIACGLKKTATPTPVASPSLSITSDTVERALADCEHLLRDRGATSGVDRVHTAFHGYLKVVCNRAGIGAGDDASITTLFKLLRQIHPAFAKAGPRQSDVDKVARAMAMAIDALNPLRNDATLAHPSEAVLETAEAMLVINAVRTLLHYMNEKLV